MKRYYLLLLAAVSLAAYSCQKEAAEPVGTPVPLVLAAEMGDAVEAELPTRTDYTDGSKFSAWVTDASGEEKQIDYTYNGSAWTPAEGSPALTVLPEAKTVPVRAWGSFSTAAGFVPGRFTGDATVTIVEGKAVASITFAPASAIVRVLVTDPLGGGDLPGASFTVTSSLLRRTTGAWSGLPDTPGLGTVAFGTRSAGVSTQIAGKAVATGDELFTLTCTTDAGTIKAGDIFTIKAPSALTLSGGRSYRITVELGNGREPSVVDVAVGDFEDGDPIIIGDKKGIWSAAHFRAFADDLATKSGQTQNVDILAKWAHTDDKIHLWNDIDLGDVELEALGQSGDFPYNFDGGNHTIKNVNMRNGGVFAFNSGTIENLHVQGRLDRGSNVGGIVSANTSAGKVVGCSFEGSISATRAGGIVGNNEGLIAGCWVKAGTTVTGTSEAGGMAGMMNGGTIAGSYSLAEEISATSKGGLAGSVQIATLSAAYWLTGSGPTDAVGSGTPASSENVDTFANEAAFTDDMIANMNAAIAAYGYEWVRKEAGQYPVIRKK